MEFYMKDVIKITGVKRERLREWVKRGYVSPSIKKSSAPRMRNIYSRDDLYRIKLVKNMFESGWYREAAMQMINKISNEGFNKLIQINDTVKYPFLSRHIELEYAVYENNYQDKIKKNFNEHFIYNPDPFKIAELLGYTRKDFALMFEKLDQSFSLKFVFARYYNEEMPIDGNGDGVFCNTLVEVIEDGVVDQQWSDEMMEDIYSGLSATDFYYINIGNIFDRINREIYVNYPDRYGREFQRELIRFFGKKELLRLEKHGEIKLRYHDEI